MLKNQIGDSTVEQRINDFIELKTSNYDVLSNSLKPRKRQNLIVDVKNMVSNLKSNEEIADKLNISIDKVVDIKSEFSLRKLFDEQYFELFKDEVEHFKCKIENKERLIEGEYNYKFKYQLKKGGFSFKTYNTILIYDYLNTYDDIVFIADKMNLDVNTIFYSYVSKDKDLIKKFNCSPRKRISPSEAKERNSKILKLYKKGVTTKEISEKLNIEYNVCANTISRLTERKVPLSKEKQKRNLRIIKDFKSGYNYEELSKKYKLTTGRINAIVLYNK